jgi:hypothetical protein
MIDPRKINQPVIGVIDQDKINHPHIKHVRMIKRTVTASGSAPSITVAVFRCVIALLLSVMRCSLGVVTLCHLLPAVAGYPVPAAARSRVL